jgi:tetratricopeptide (TPR) repeat protein
MPKTFTQYRVFIASPGELDTERKTFRSTLDDFTTDHDEKSHIWFRPVGWEETAAGVARPQRAIGEDLKRCDYVIFVFYDRWGSPTGDGHGSGTEEEWELAEQLYSKALLRGIAVLFKKVDPIKQQNPDWQLAQVMDFRKRIEGQKRHWTKEFVDEHGFQQEIKLCLRQWSRDHNQNADFSYFEGMPILSKDKADIHLASSHAARLTSPTFDYWIAEAARLLDPQQPTINYEAVVFCLDHAATTSRSDKEWAEATNAVAIVNSVFDKIAESIAALDGIFDRFIQSRDLVERSWQAKALFNRAILLLRLRRREAAAQTYNQLVDQFAGAPELQLREFVAHALFRKADIFSRMNEFQQEIASYEEVVSVFGEARELSMRELVARALFEKVERLGIEGGEKAIAVYRDIIARYESATESSLREQTAKALLGEANLLYQLRKKAHEVHAICNRIVNHFSSASELSLREHVAEALLLKGKTFGQGGQFMCAIKVFRSLVDHFGQASDLVLQKRVAEALVYAGATLWKLDKPKERIEIYNEVIERFGWAREPPLVAYLGEALLQKAIVLDERGLTDESAGAYDEEAISAYDAVIECLNAVEDTVVREIVQRARMRRESLQPDHFR